ncbi:uncharacterized protein LTR77_011249 [Saxophila tyrrhenica]|uniref:Uncharacterized protein n=1 Tax=Saxophila tyrrhenica TaxID=1690608 RepID=A0AAV9NWQ8_9PEZI|nr:hypothetical protein LTR77_011249 [Saxophila tyrrhenica]
MTQIVTGSDANSLYNLLCVDLIRDYVMDTVAPVDVVNFMIGTGIRFTSQDMKRYASLVKYIIPNRRWLKSKIRDGYEFILVSKNLTAFINTNGYDLRRRISFSSRGPSPCRINSDVVLIAMKDSNFVRCTNDFMDGSGAEVLDTPTHWPSTMKFGGIEANVMTVTMDQLRVALWCVDEDKPVDMPLIMDANMIISSKLNAKVHMTKVQYMYLNTDENNLIHTSLCRVRSESEVMTTAKTQCVLATPGLGEDSAAYRAHVLIK